MSRGVKAVVLCEDLQHAVFVRAFLYCRGFTRHDLDVRVSPSGDAKQFVRERFATELTALRRYPGTGRILVVLTDADNLSVIDRLRTLQEACISRGVAPPEAGEPVFCFVPKWEIENWLAYLRGEVVNEERSSYSKLKFESDAYPVVEHLADMCQNGQLLPEPPPSLDASCSTHARLLEFLRHRSG